LGLSSEQPMHFCEGKAELFPLGGKAFGRKRLCRKSRKHTEIFLEGVNKIIKILTGALSHFVWRLRTYVCRSEVNMANAMWAQFGFTGNRIVWST
jgi:hypothetical protein